MGSSKSHYKEGYWDWNNRRQELLPLGLSIINFFKPTRILDVGCGLGITTKAFRVLGYEAYGVDISPWAIGHADEDVRPHLTIADICESIPFPDGYFDLTMSVDTLEHIEEPSINRAIDNIVRVSSKHIFIQQPMPEYLGVPLTDPVDRSHVLQKPIPFWMNLFTSRGFKIFHLANIGEENYQMSCVRRAAT